MEYNENIWMWKQVNGEYHQVGIVVYNEMSWMLLSSQNNRIMGAASKS